MNSIFRLGRALTLGNFIKDNYETIFHPRHDYT